LDSLPDVNHGNSSVNSQGHTIIDELCQAGAVRMNASLIARAKYCTNANLDLMHASSRLVAMQEPVNVSEE